MVSKRRKRKGFSRTAKEWEESFATHVGKIIDNLKAEDILNLVASGISAYGGYAAAKRLGGDEVTALGGAASGIIAYQLAKAPNIVAGASGTAYLASLGIVNLWDPITGVAKALPMQLTEFWAHRLWSLVYG